MLSIYCACWIYWLIVHNTLKIKHCVVNKHSLMSLSWFFFLALLLLCPRCKYFAAATSRQAGWPAAWATCWFQLKAFTSIVLWLFPSIANTPRCLLLLFPCLLVQGQDKGISMIGEKGPSFAAGCHFPLPNTQMHKAANRSTTVFIGC